MNKIEIFQPLKNLIVYWERKPRYGLVSVTVEVRDQGGASKQHVGWWEVESQVCLP